MLSKDLLLEIKKAIEDYLELDVGEVGLCDFLNKRGAPPHMESVKSFLNDCGRSWDKFSGCNIYPVPAPKGYIEVPKEYRMPSDELAMYIYEKTPINCYLKGEYGELRKEYCHHLIKCIESALKGENYA